jgi:hypothetical protein
MNLSALEQYQCYVSIDASCDQMILTFMNAYENTGESIYREQAVALANSLVNYQTKTDLCHGHKQIALNLALWHSVKNY